MKKILITCGLFLLFIFSFPSFGNVRATEEPPIKELLFGGNDIPGITCGDGSNEDINKCCNVSINSEVEVKDPGFFCLPFGGPCASELPQKAFKGFYKDSVPANMIDDTTDLANDSGGCVIGVPTNLGSSSCTCKASSLTSFCNRYAAQSEKSSCNKCVINGDAFWTGLGCIGLTPAGFARSASSLGLGLGGTAALLCIIYSAFVLQTSRGNPERIKKAKEYLTSCIMGLIIMILSVFILKIIGVELLRIPFLQ